MNDVHFIQVDAAQTEAEALARFEKALGESPAETDERRIMLQIFLQYLIGCYAYIDKTGRDNLVDFSEGDALIGIGRRTGTLPIEAAPAHTILEFTLAAAQPQAVSIPQGTRATADGRVFFATEYPLTIPTGQISGSVEAASILQDGGSGETHNGIAAGWITNLVDRVPFVQAVRNTVATAGGSAPESEDAYRERITLSPTRFSAAGSEGSYVYHARAASSDIMDVAATMPSPGCSLITVLLPEGYADAEHVLELVQKECSDRDVRAVTDNLSVALPEVVGYTINLVYYAELEQEAAITAAIEGPGGAIQQYLEWQSGALNRAVNPDKLRALCFSAGAERVDLTLPQYAAVSKTQVARCTGMNVRCEVIT